MNTALYFFSDGHHKLVRWGMVTHCGIDGYSRLVVYLKSSNNNTASTDNLFLEAVDLFGYHPEFIRIKVQRTTVLLNTEAWWLALQFTIKE